MSVMLYFLLGISKSVRRLQDLDSHVLYWLAMLNYNWMLESIMCLCVTLCTLLHPLFVIGRAENEAQPMRQPSLKPEHLAK
jgi:hypothetical protein